MSSTETEGAAAEATLATLAVAGRDFGAPAIGSHEGRSGTAVIPSPRGAVPSGVEPKTTTPVGPVRAGVRAYWLPVLGNVMPGGGVPSGVMSPGAAPTTGEVDGAEISERSTEPGFADAPSVEPGSEELEPEPVSEPVLEPAERESAVRASVAAAVAAIAAPDRESVAGEAPLEAEDPLLDGELVLEVEPVLATEVPLSSARRSRREPGAEPVSVVMLWPGFAWGVVLRKSEETPTVPAEADPDPEAEAVPEPDPDPDADPAVAAAPVPDAEPSEKAGASSLGGGGASGVGCVCSVHATPSHHRIKRASEASWYHPGTGEVSDMAQPPCDARRGFSVGR